MNNLLMGVLWCWVFQKNEILYIVYSVPRLSGVGSKVNNWKFQNISGNLRSCWELMTSWSLSIGHCFSGVAWFPSAANTWGCLLQMQINWLYLVSTECWARPVDLNFKQESSHSHPLQRSCLENPRDGGAW